MTFVEALKSDRPMRRKAWWQGVGGNRWLQLDAQGEWFWTGGGSANSPTRHDMLAEDWEVMSFRRDP